MTNPLSWYRIKKQLGRLWVFQISQRLKILLVDDHPLTRSGLQVIVGFDERYEVCGVLDHVEKVIPFIRSNEIDIVLLDMNFPDMDATNFLEELVGVMDARIIIVTADDSYNKLSKCFKMGVKAIISKSDPVECILTGIDEVISGEKYFSPDVLKIVGDFDLSAIELSSRQLTVLKFLSEGETNKEIAYKLKIAPVTVTYHLNQLRSKLGVRGNKKIVPKARELGLI